MRSAALITTKHDPTPSTERLFVLFYLFQAFCAVEKTHGCFIYLKRGVLKVFFFSFWTGGLLGHYVSVGGGEKEKRPSNQTVLTAAGATNLLSNALWE